MTEPANVGCRILLADDERNLRRTLERTLLQHGHEVIAVDTVRTTIAALAAAPFDVVVLDVNLPDGTGWDVLRTIPPAARPPVIVFSAVPPSRRRVDELQPAAVLLKPFPIESLLRLVNEVTSGPVVVGEPPG